MLINVLIFLLIFSVNIYSFAQFKDLSTLDTKFSFLSKKKPLPLSNDSVNFYANHSLKRKSSKVFMFSIGSLDYIIDREAPEREIKKMQLDTKKSKTYGLALMIRNISLYKNSVYLLPGVGIEKNNYSFKNKNVSIVAGNDSLTFLSNRLVTFYKYQLMTTYLQAPLLIGFRFGSITNPINFHAGILGGINIATLTKEKYFIEQTKFKNKIIDNYHINRYKLEAISRLYFGKIGVFGKYALTSLFEKGKAPKTQPFTVGITLSNI